MSTSLEQRIGQAVGQPVQSMGPLTGGCVGEVYRARLRDGRDVVVKVDDGASPQLDTEGYMLEYLAAKSSLPVPAVHHSEPSLLVMEFMPGTSMFSRAAEQHAADLLADLHGITAAQYGLERDTLIGSLHQPNALGDQWVPFFRDQRLMAMSRQAHDAGRMDGEMLGRIETFAGKLEEYLREPERPALLHGDVWSANVLADGSRITAFIDPAIYYGHPEIELAFISLFVTFGDTFFRRYSERRPIGAGFFEERCDIYNLYPLLVHVRLFGGGYLSGIERTLGRLGY